MPQPTRTQVHVDAPLTDISVAYVQDLKQYVASQVFPVVPVDKASNKFFKYTKNDWFRDEAKPRGDSEESAGSGYGLTTDNYVASVYAFHKDISDFVRQNSDTPLDADRDATMFVTQRLMQRLEVQWAGDYFKTGVWGTDVTGVASSPSASQFIQWSDFTASDPRNDIDAGKEGILNVTGFVPNTLLLGYQVFRKLIRHPDVTDQFKYTSSESISEAMLAQFLGIDRVIVAKSVVASNKEGQTDSFAFNFGKSALLCYSNPKPGILQPSAGYVFAWTGVSDGLGQTLGISRIRMENLKSDRIEGQIAFADKVVSSDLGYFFATAVA
jgi:hypothetical protein